MENPLKNLFPRDAIHPVYTTGLAAAILILIWLNFTLQEPEPAAVGSAADSCSVIVRYFHSMTPLSTAPLYRLLAIAALGAFIAWFPSRLRKHFLDGRKVGWWLPRSGHGAKDMSWKDAFELASLEARSDPARLETWNSPPTASRLDITIECLAFFATACLVAIALDFVLRPHVPAILLSDPAKKNSISSIIDVTGSLTAYLAILTAVLGLYVARFTIRAQVRSKSRQEWIDRVRQLMAAPVCRVHSNEPHAELRDSSFRRRLIQLELLLNPSEKDHRLLTMLFWARIFPSESVGMDVELRQEFLRLHKDPQLPASSRRLLSFLLKNDVGGRIIAPDMVAAQATRLSQSILKREWVRVTATE